MNYLLQNTAAAHFDVVERAPSAIINVEGSTATARKMSALINMSRPALIATAGFGGKTGKAAMASIVNDVAADLARPAAWPLCDYRPLAQTIAAQLGEVVVVSNRASFESLCDQFDGRIATHKAKSKSGGYRVKDGVEIPDAAHAKLLQLRGLIGDVVSLAREFSAENKAKHEAAKAEKTAQLEQHAEKTNG